MLRTHQYVVAPAAQDDLFVIWHYYAEEVGDPDLADRMVGEIVSGFQSVVSGSNSHYGQESGETVETVGPQRGVVHPTEVGC